MPISTQLKEYLDQNHVKYVTCTHSKAYTAQEIAALAHIPGKEMAKAVIVKLDGEYIMAVLPASYKVDFKLLAQATGAKKVELATEGEFAEMFPGCEIGAMPIFGNIYGLSVYVSESLIDDEEIAFNAGTHSIAIKMAFADFKKFVKPTVIRFSKHV